MSNPFDYINSVSYNKNNLMKDSGNDQLAEQQYKPFIVNKGLSYFVDTILLANELNVRPHLDNKLQYEYLLNTIRPKKRFSKWVKKVDSDDVEAVQQYFQYNDEDAVVATSLLTDQQLTIIKEKLSKGGMNYECGKHGRSDFKV